jgi:hypothetical protein
MANLPDPNVIHPIAAHPRVVFLKPLIHSPTIIVGDHTYYDDPDDLTAFERENVLYAFGPERLVIGKYCALASGVRFIMAGGNHPTAGVSTFPFAIFGGAWAERTTDLIYDPPHRGDTVVGNDVWFGYQSMIMPGGPDRGRSDRRRRCRGQPGRPALRHRRWQPSPPGPHPFRRGGCEPLATLRLVGLAGRPGHGARPYDHGRQPARDRTHRPAAWALPG